MDNATCQEVKSKGQTDQPTNQPTNQPTS